MFLHIFGFKIFWLFLVEFSIAAAIVLIAGKQLSVYGDKIATASKFSHGWIGFILLAAITSLPELMTGISATGIVGSVNLMISDTIGSNAVNIVILAIMFLISTKKVFKLKIEETVTIFSGLFLSTLIAIFIIVNQLGFIISQAMSISFSVILFLFYLMTVIVTFKTGGLKEEHEEQSSHDEKYIWLKFAFFALLIVGGATWMTQTAEHIAYTPLTIGTFTFILGESFVGALLLSIATSLPEFTVTLNCAKMGNMSMAVGNIFGSNIFNIFIIPISSIFYRGNLWKDVGVSNLYLLLIVFIVTNLMALDLISRTKLNKKGISLFNIGIILAWIAGLVIVFITK